MWRVRRSWTRTPSCREGAVLTRFWRGRSAWTATRRAYGGYRIRRPRTRNLVRRIQLGSATPADLTAGGATQLGTARDDYAPCTNNGQNCADDIYAVSLPSEIPAAHITWFQAQEACANAGRRLPTSAEWQVGANGTPDPGPTTARRTATPRQDRCLLRARAAVVYRRVGLSTWLVTCTSGWPTGYRSRRAVSSWGGFSNDDMCLAGANETAHGPGRCCEAATSSRVRWPARSRSMAVPSRPFTAAGFGFRCVRESPRVSIGVETLAERSIERERR